MLSAHTMSEPREYEFTARQQASPLQYAAAIRTGKADLIPAGLLGNAGHKVYTALP